MVFVFVFFCVCVFLMFVCFFFVFFGKDVFLSRLVVSCYVFLLKYLIVIVCLCGPQGWCFLWEYVFSCFFDRRV